MTEAQHAEARLALGALVLGALEPLERAAVEAHVAGCAACSAELADLAVLPGLLGRLTPAQAAAIAPGLPDPVEPPTDLLERILARGPGAVAAPRRTDGEQADRSGGPGRPGRRVGQSRPVGPSRRPGRRRRWAAWSGAAAAALAGIGWLVAGPLTGSGDHRDVVVVQGRDAVSAVRAEVTLSPTPNGTQLAVALTGVRPGENCQLIAWTEDGRKEVASTWRASYQGAADVTGSTSLPLADIAGVTITTTDGRRLLKLNLPS